MRNNSCPPARAAPCGRAGSPAGEPWARKRDSGARQMRVSCGRGAPGGAQHARRRGKPQTSDAAVRGPSARRMIRSGILPVFWHAGQATGHNWKPGGAACRTVQAPFCRPCRFRRILRRNLQMTGAGGGTRIVVRLREEPKRHSNTMTRTGHLWAVLTGIGFRDKTAH